MRAILLGRKTANIRTAIGASLALIATVMSAPLAAQAYQCNISRGAVSVPRVQQSGPRRDIPVSGYTLSLSWSPEFCRTRGQSRSHSRQCSGNQGKFGFILHGLWPNGAGAQYPQYCATQRLVSPKEARRNLCMTPSTSLLAREWAKHGSCMIATPEGYFKISRILWNSLRWPDMNALSHRKGLSAKDIRQAFAKANPYWEEEHVGLVVNGRGWLSEMRLCYGKNFMPTRCNNRQFGAKDRKRVKIWRDE